MTNAVPYVLAGAAVAMPTLLTLGARAGVPLVNVHPTPGQVAALASLASALTPADVVGGADQFMTSNVLLRAKVRLGLRDSLVSGDSDAAIAAFKADDADKLLTAWISAVQAGTKVGGGYRIVTGSGSASGDADDSAVDDIVAGKSVDDLQPLGRALLRVVAEHAAIRLGGVFGDPLPYNPQRVLDNILALCIAMDDQGADLFGGKADPTNPSVFDALKETFVGLATGAVGNKAGELVDAGVDFLKGKLKAALPSLPDGATIAVVVGVVIVGGIVIARKLAP